MVLSIASPGDCSTVCYRNANEFTIRARCPNSGQLNQRILQGNLNHTPLSIGTHFEVRMKRLLVLSPA
jgi:hypothetical protein